MESKLSRSIAAALLMSCSLLLTGCGVAQKAKDAVLAKALTPTAIAKFTDLSEGSETKKQVEMYCGDDVKFEDIARETWWPGQGKGSCLEGKVGELDAFNKKHGGKKVSYKSRPGKTDNGNEIEVVELTGWWLPAPGATKETPRIVVQHGFQGNSNKVRSQYAAYLLRKAGYSVLLNNFRDHCYSDDSKEAADVVSWGEAYPLDLLGAWDYLVKDVEAGAIDESKVGILGFSMGAFTTLNAFGIEGKVPAVWVDGPPLSPKAGFSAGLMATLKGQKVDMSFLHSHLLDDTWKQVEEDAMKKGVDLNAHLPEKELPKGPKTKRPLFIVANKDDATVLYENSENLVDFLKGREDQYTPTFFSTEGTCDGENHCFDHLRVQDEYEDKLKTFWSGVFDQKQDEATEGDSSKTEKLFLKENSVAATTYLSPLAWASVAAFAAAGFAAVATRAHLSRRSVTVEETCELGELLED